LAKKKYRVVVQRQVGPNTWEKVFAVSGPADNATDALVKATTRRTAQVSGDTEASNYRSPNGSPYYPNVTVKLTNTGSSPFSAVNKVRTALRQAGVPAAEIGRFSKESIGGGLDSRVNGKDTIFQTCEQWVNIV
jgi:hypothetical protein